MVFPELKSRWRLVTYVCVCVMYLHTYAYIYLCLTIKKNWLSTRGGKWEWLEGKGVGKRSNSISIKTIFFF